MTDTDDWDDIARKLSEAARKQRPYAAYFDWPDRRVAEWGIATELSRVAAGEPGFPLSSIQSRDPGCDPPDCEAFDAEGRRVALEITELVDGRAIKHARAGRGHLWAAWDRQEFLSRLEDLLSAKDGKALKGGPYAEYIVVIHTDEPELPIDVVSSWLADQTFSKPQQIDRAYLLVSYSPQAGSCTYVRLQW